MRGSRLSLGSAAYNPVVARRVREGSSAAREKAGEEAEQEGAYDGNDIRKVR